jgi:hypothetical protein
MKNLILILPVILFLSTGCKTIDEEATELMTKANFKGEAIQKLGFLNGVDFYLNYNDQPIIGEFMIDGIWGPQLSGYSVNLKIGEHNLKGKLRMTFFMQNYEVELMYGSIPISGVFKRGFWDTWNWEINLKFGSDDLFGRIEHDFSTITFNFTYWQKTIQGTKELKFIKERYHLLFGEKILKGIMLYKMGKENWLFEADQLTGEDLVIFLLIDFLRIMQQDYERMQNASRSGQASSEGLRH